MPDDNGLEILETGAGDPAIEQVAAKVAELVADIEDFASRQKLVVKRLLTSSTKCMVPTFDTPH